MRPVGRLLRLTVSISSHPHILSGVQVHGSQVQPSQLQSMLSQAILSSHCVIHAIKTSHRIFSYTIMVILINMVSGRSYIIITEITFSTLPMWFTV